MEMLQVSTVASEEKYMGLPMPLGRMSGTKFKSTRLAQRRPDLLQNDEGGIKR
jgi:hypothetical protein